MKVHMFVDEGLGHSSYLIDLGDGSGAVIDPPRFITAHHVVAEREGLTVVWTIDTHSHADYVTGSPSLARRGATFVAPAASRLTTPHHGVTDGENIELVRRVRLTALATPGHTPDHYAYILEHDGRPVALFSGGSLMVGTVGRTDLSGPDLVEPLAHEMFRSLRRFDDLPGDLTVYPTHGAGSFCSAASASDRTSTLERERATNALFSTGDEGEFVTHLVHSFGTFPTYFSRLPELNRFGPTHYDSIPSLPSLLPEDLERHIVEGGVVVDARPAASFSERHVPGAVSNALRDVFGSWLGWLIEPDRPIVFVLEPHQDRSDLVRQCLDVGHEQLAGELAGGIDAWTASGRATSTLPLVDANRISRQIIDVRQAHEFAAGHIPGARNVELALVHAADLPGMEMTVMCGHGERAMTAASLLARRGRRDVTVFDGGPDTWSNATQRPLSTGP